jgi:hypothetical protein
MQSVSGLRMPAFFFMSNATDASQYCAFFSRLIRERQTKLEVAT